MHLLLDTGLLGQLCHPGNSANKPASDWVQAILRSGSEDRVFLPEVCDYELRRKLLHLIQKGQSTQRSIQRLDELGELLDYLPLETSMMRKAAEFWCDSRLRGNQTASNESFDGDVILAAQAAAVSGTVVTTNRKHLAQFVPARDRTEILWAYGFVCVRGPIDNLAFDWKDHFLVQDTQGRSWHCRHEATWNSREELDDGKQLLARLMSDLPDVTPMYQKLYASGYKTTEGTVIIAHITMNTIPASRQALIADLAVSLGKDDATDASDE
jgi:predicted nucleic acid-binding protein